MVFSIHIEVGNRNPSSVCGESVHTVERLPHTHVEMDVRRSSGRRRPVRHFVVNKINGFRSSSDISGRRFFYTFHVKKTIVAGRKKKLHIPIGGYI